MYTSYFGFRENPFSLTPDPNYLYLSRHHKEAFDHLLYGINERKGFIVITGGIGTGKTTLCRALLGTFDASTKTALIFNAYLSDMELLKTINQEFGIGGTPGESKKGYIDNLNHFLLETFSQGGNAVLLIDEAQNLSHTVLEQIRMLSNLETEKEKLVQIVLVGQLELREVLASPALQQLDERIMVRYDLQPLDRADVQGYVEHRLVVAGGRGNVRFTHGALEALYGCSQGNPRRINGVCDRALLIAYSKDEFTISKKTIQKALEDIRGAGTIAPGQARSWLQRRVTLLPVLLVFLLVIVAGFGGWNLREEITALLSDEQTTAPPAQILPPGEGKSERLPGEQVVAEDKNENAPSVSAKPEAKWASLFLGEQATCGALFSFFNPKDSGSSPSARQVHLGLYTFYADAEYYIMFKKPFRVRVNVASRNPALTSMGAPSDPRYLLIREVTADGAIAIDAEGKERSIDRNFILTHWDKEVCWVYPYENHDTNLVRGMRGPSVIKVQQALNEIGYSVKPSGAYDALTYNQVVRFQKDFGLRADGIVGTRTKGLLYQMTNELHP